MESHFFVMEKWSLSEFLEGYDVDFERIINDIRSNSAKRVLLQFPEGFKPYSTAIVDYLEKKIEGVEFFIWIGSCFGACDYPVGVDEMGIDLMVQIGHNSLMPSY